MTKPAMKRKTRVLVTSQSLVSEFGRCCEEYSALHIAVAWCGDPKQATVFKLLKRFGENLTATIGIAFCHTHPDAIDSLRRISPNVRVFRGDEPLFHPKVFLFTDGNRYAAFVGSSNLTRGGFHGNAEVNTLIEGTFADGKGEDIRELQRTLEQWHSPIYSFEPTDDWLSDYRDQYRAAVANARQSNVRTPTLREETAMLAGWLRTADWPAYYRRVIEGLRQSGRSAYEYHEVLDAAASELPIPWDVAYFEDAEKRKVMGGMHPYGWLGHVAAAGMLRKLLANGMAHDWQTIVDAVNRIATWNHPIPWSELEAELNRLNGLKFTMKVWGRFLCLVRPELYCTVASNSVRANLSKTLQVGQTAFIDQSGYIQLLKLIHSSPWFLSAMPSDPIEAAIWRRRLAFLDAIFY